ncbi:MAG: YceI family protein [Chitinophagaceae bacterium]|nr:YceI family protein [Chitinophagaceae bacterium]
MIKKSFIVLGTVVLFAACNNAPESDKAVTTDAKEVTAAEGTVLKVDTAASKINWVATKVSAYHTGTINIKNGEVKANDSSLTGGNFVLDMNSILVSGPAGSDAGMNTKLNGHLKSADFFDVEKNPEATFVITGVQTFSGTVKDTTDPRQESISEYKVANPTHTISGNLTIKGITKNISFPAKISVSPTGVDAIAKFNIDRTQWNIVYPGKPDDLIRNDIHLGIALKATR